MTPCPHCGKVHPPKPIILGFLGFIDAVFNEDGPARAWIFDATDLEDKKGFALHCTCGARGEVDDWLNYVFCPECKKALSEKGAVWEGT